MCGLTVACRVHIAPVAFLQVVKKYQYKPLQYIRVVWLPCAGFTLPQWHSYKWWKNININPCSTYEWFDCHVQVHIAPVAFLQVVKKYQYKPLQYICVVWLWHAGFTLPQWHSCKWWKNININPCSTYVWFDCGMQGSHCPSDILISGETISI